jgi:endonuclease YncB( thermonuclease family)
MYEYKFHLKRVVDGNTVDGIIDLGFGIKLHERVKLLGVNAPETLLQKSIKDSSKRKAERDRGLKAKKRLKEILAHGSKQPEGLYIETFLTEEGRDYRILGEIKYVYAKDLYNNKEGSKPWVGWQSVSKQLLNEDLVELI